MSGSAKVALAACSKHTVQIIQLLTERSLSFSFCLNKNEMLVGSGFGLLSQNLDLERGSTLMKENQRLTFIIAHILDRQPSRASVEFRRISTALAMQQHVSLPNPPRRTPILSRHNSDGNLNQAQETMSSTQKHIRAIMSRFSSGTKPVRPDERRATIPAVNLDMSNNSRTSLSSIQSEPGHARSEPAMSPEFQRTNISPPKQTKRSNSSIPDPSTNLDYLPLGSTASITSAYNLASGSLGKANVTTSDWERMLSSLDNGQTNIYDGIYGGPPIEALTDVAALPPPADAQLMWSPDVWSIGNTSVPPQSVLSFSDESLTSGEEFPDLTHCTSNESSYKGILIPEMSPASMESFGLAGLDGGFGL
jgi:hypothetical protein